MATATKAIAPKNGERVRSAQHEGVFEIVGVNSLMQTANIRLIDGSYGSRVSGSSGGEIPRILPRKGQSKARPTL